LNGRWKGARVDLIGIWIRLDMDGFIDKIDVIGPALVEAIRL
jgi:hypothetical protein